MNLSGGGDFSSATVNMGLPELVHLEPTAGVAGVGSGVSTLALPGRTFSITPCTVGNPHCVVVLGEAADGHVRDFDVARWGALIEKHPCFAPHGVNVEFVSVESPVEVAVRTWERGSGETQVRVLLSPAAVSNGSLQRLSFT